MNFSFIVYYIRFQTGFPRSGITTPSFPRQNKICLLQTLMQTSYIFFLSFDK